MNISEYIEKSIVDIPSGSVILIEDKSYISKKLRIPSYPILMDLIIKDISSIKDGELLSIAYEPNIWDLLEYEGYTEPAIYDPLKEEIHIVDCESYQDIIDSMIQIRIGANGTIIKPGSIEIDTLKSTDQYSMVHKDIRIGRLSIFDPEDISLKIRYLINTDHLYKEFNMFHMIGFNEYDFDKGNNYQEDTRIEAGCTQVLESSSFEAIIIELK